MRVEVTRENIEDNILFVIKGIMQSKDIKYKEIFSKIEKSLLNKNIVNGGMILSGSQTLDTLSIQELYHVMKALYDEIQIEKINPERYFTPIEIEELNKFKKEMEQDIDKVIFKDFLQVQYDQWIGVMYIRDIARLIGLNKINYNFATQREAVIKESKTGDVIIMKPKTYESSVNSIYKALEENTYIPDCITFNILKTGKEEIEYKNNDIVIYQGEINALDGWHRDKAFLRYVSKNKDTDKVIEVRITNFDEVKANRFLNQINKQNKIDERHLASRDTSKYENEIVRKLNEESDLRGKIATDYDSVRQRKAVIGFDTLAEGIKNIFEIKNSRDARIIGEYLIDFFNEIYGIFNDDFENIWESKKNTYKLNQLTFMGYLYLAKKLYKQNNWRGKLEQILQGINFDNDNKELENLVGKKIAINNKSVERIYEYFEEKIHLKSEVI